jgi:uncharacterized OsmC-like protein
MVTIKQKTVVQVKVKGHCASHARTDIAVRDTETTIDEPQARGGTNMAPSPTETALAALVGCTNVIAHKIAHKYSVEFQAMEVDLEALFDRRGVTLAEEIDVPFPEIKLTISVTTDASEAQIETIKTELAMYCPVAKLFRMAGSKLTEEWAVTRP